MRDTIELAREAGFEVMRLHGVLPHVPKAIFIANVCVTEELKAFEALVRADEREQGQKWFEAVTAQHKQLILAEREACAKDFEAEADTWTAWSQAGAARRKGAAAIRARGNT
jgi:N-dimethylarginine dimethylaminohydrolase